MKKLIILGVLFLATNAFADTKMFNLPKKYVDECGSCHIAYPGELLPKESWNNVMANLDKHFGNNASLDKKSFDEVSKYLLSTNTYRKAQVTNDNKITSANWFKREHHEIRLKAKESFSNCISCHKSSDTGNFSLKGYKGEHDD